MSDVSTIAADVPAPYADAVAERVRRAVDEDVVRRIWAKDGTLWAPEGTPEVTDRLGWLDIADRMAEQVDDLRRFSEDLRGEGYADAVLLGMGGSSLAPEVAVAGWALEIDPFDQPNVQEAKDNRARVLAEGPPELEDGDAHGLLGGAAPPRYVAIMGYLPYSDATDAAVAELRRRLVGRSGVATTWGYGPRFPHSTGQEHKGGPAHGAFLQLVDEPAGDLDVPGESFSFATLIRAQADGDLQTLRSHGLDAVRIHVSGPSDIEELS